MIQDDILKLNQTTQDLDVALALLKNVLKKQQKWMDQQTKEVTIEKHEITEGVNEINLRIEENVEELVGLNVFIKQQNLLIKEQKEEISRNREDIKKLTTELILLRTDLNKQSQELTQAKQNRAEVEANFNKSTKTPFDTLQQQLNDQKKIHEESGNKIDKLQTTTNELQDKISLNTNMVANITLGKNDYLWKITNTSSKRNLKISPPFYTSEYGYKLLLEMCLDVEDTEYVPIYTHIAPGDYDQILDRPFKKSLQITIIHQTDYSKHKSYPVDYSSDRKNALHVVGLLPAWGYSKCMNKKDFFSEENSYVKDDTVFVLFQILD